MTPPGRTWRRAALALLASLAVTAAALAAWPALQEARARAHGSALFEGRQPLAGRLLGHAADLPPDAARCVNCHRAPGAAGAAFAPALQGATLTSAHARRGGPPSRYDAQSFCRLLRSGIDPAWVQIPRDMPRYDIADADCQALWAHVAAQPAVAAR